MFPTFVSTKLKIWSLERWLTLTILSGSFDSWSILQRWFKQLHRKKKIFQHFWSIALIPYSKRHCLRHRVRVKVTSGLQTWPSGLMKRLPNSHKLLMMCSGSEYRGWARLIAQSRTFFCKSQAYLHLWMLSHFSKCILTWYFHHHCLPHQYYLWHPTSRWTAAPVLKEGDNGG